MSEYVPTTDEIRDDYAHMIAPHTAWGEDGFDAWLDVVRAVARREGQAEAWDRAESAAWDAHKRDHHEPWGHMPVNPYRNGEGQ